MLREAIKSGTVREHLFAAILQIKSDLTAKDGRTYHVLDISDSTCKLKLYLWSDSCPFKAKTFIKFKAGVMNNFFFCKLEDIREVSPALIPEGNPVKNIQFRFNIDTAMLAHRIRTFAKARVESDSFKLLIESTVTQEFLDKLRPFPAGKSVHHSIEGGLLKHIEEMFDIYEKISEISICDNLRHEFVILGIVIHDYFKYREYIPTDDSFAMTESASLLGHIYQGANFVQSLVQQFNASNRENEISNSDKQKLIHVILAHHGQLDWGSPVVPAIPEAMLLHYIDQISAKLNMFKNSTHMEFNKFLGAYPIL